MVGSAGLVDSDHECLRADGLAWSEPRNSLACSVTGLSRTGVVLISSHSLRRPLRRSPESYMRSGT